MWRGAPQDGLSLPCQVLSAARRTPIHARKSNVLMHNFTRITHIKKYPDKFMICSLIGEIEGLSLRRENSKKARRLPVIPAPC
jgi:hypothetical protein